MRIVQRKWPGRPHYEFSVEPLGEDEHGRWFGAPAGNQIVRPDRSVVPFRHPFALLVPEAGWWFAMWNDLPHECDVYVNVTDHGYLDDRVLRCFDLDLDVVRLRDGRVYIDDEDEFQLHSRLHAYPDDLLRGARRAADSMLEVVREGREPFSKEGAGPRWLAQARLLAPG